MSHLREINIKPTNLSTFIVLINLFLNIFNFDITGSGDVLVNNYRQSNST